MSGLKPDAVVLVATVRALKYNGGSAKADLGTENLEALEKGIVNLEKHIENLQKYDVPVVVTLNSFVSDTEAEIAYVKSFCEERGCEFAISQVWEKGGEGGITLAEKVLDTLEKKESHFHVLYADELSLEEKINAVSRGNLRSGWRGIFPCGAEAAEKAYRAGIRRPARMYGKDSIFSF